MGPNELSNEVFMKTIDEIGLKVQTNFVENLYENITDKDTIQILKEIESYWYDRDRSALIWFCNEIVGGDPEKTLPLSLIMSLSSAGIGIHDDIIDKTIIKKYQKTITGTIEPEKAIVIGDLLIIKGLTSLDSLLEIYDIRTFSSIIKIFRNYFHNLAVGELWEINARKNLHIDLDTYHDMLWRLGIDGDACARLGAISGNASKEQVEVLSFFGRSLGYIMRLRDEIGDILNYEGNIEKRIMYESIPLSLLYISKQSKSHYKQIENILNREKIDNEEIKNILNMCYDSNAFKYINNKIHEVYQKAIKSIDIFPESDTKNMLIKIIDLKKDQSDWIY